MGEKELGWNRLSDENALNENTPSSDDGWYQQGMNQWEAGSLEDAITSFDQALQYNTKNDQAWYGKGQTLAQLEQHEAAIDCYSQALNLNPNAPEIWAAHGKALGTLTRYAEAICSYETALNLHREAGDRQSEAKTLFTLNMLYPLDGRMNESAKAFQQLSAILNELDTPLDGPMQMSIMGGLALPNRQIFFLVNQLRRLLTGSVPRKVRSIVLRAGWMVFFGLSVLLVWVAMAWWMNRSASKRSGEAA